MDICYLTALGEGKDNLAQVADELFRYSCTVCDKGEFLGAPAMIPKLVLNPTHNGLFPDLEHLTQEYRDKHMYVYEVKGEDCDSMARDIRGRFQLKTTSNSTVHITRSPEENKIVKYAKKNNSEKTIQHILRNYELWNGEIRRKKGVDT